MIDIVFAETRGQATYRFWQRYADDLGGLTEHTYKTCLLRRRVPDKMMRGAPLAVLERKLWHEVAAAEEKRAKEKAANDQLDH